MQVVINISKDDFEEICMQARMVEDTGSLFGRIRKAISHGVPLPKGHGNLADKKEIIERYKRDCGRRIYADEFIHNIEVNVQTIIKADEVESEETDDRD